MTLSTSEETVMQSGLAELHAEGRIAVLTIENGTKNLLSEPEFIQREALLSWLDARPQICALIITGKGRHFSHGADTSLFENPDIPAISEKLRKARELLNTIERLPLVTAAAVNGGCFGGGLEIALSCQFRIASPKAVLGLTEIMHGVVPGMGGMERLARLLGREKALPMILRGEMLTAQQALSAGLVTKITEQKDAFPETVQFVQNLISGISPAQIRAVTETLARDADGMKDPSQGKFEALLREREHHEA